MNKRIYILILVSLSFAFLALSGVMENGSPSYSLREGSMTVDLTGYTEVFTDDFDEGLNIHNGKTGIWSTGTRLDKLVSNGPQSVFLDGEEVTTDGKMVGVNPFSAEDGILNIGAGVLSDAELAKVEDVLVQVGQEEYIGRTQYYTGMISSHDTWAQTYGYFEIVAQVPEGRGHWSAFWMSTAGMGWPPEIDIFEAYGRGVHGETKKDDVFHSAVWFDATDINGEKTQSTDLLNPYELDENGNPSAPDEWHVSGNDQFRHGTEIDIREALGANIYDEFWTYSVQWTPEEIVFYFGKDRDSMVEIYRTPTPEDVNSPMYMMANDQISSRWGWNPVNGFDDQTFAEDNGLKIDSISVWALNPENTVQGGGARALLVDGDESSFINGTAGDDVIVTGQGQDIVTLGGGRDILFADRGLDNKIVADFGSDDRLVLEGYNFENAQDVVSRLTQFGDDVWLSNGGFPVDPQTIIFRDAKVSDFSADNFIVRWAETPDIWFGTAHDGTWLKDTDQDGRIEAAPGGSKITDAGANTSNGPLVIDGSDAGDVYYIYSGQTVIEENKNGGIDTVYAHWSHALAENVENLIVNVPIKKEIFLTGNGLGNLIRGNAGEEIFIGAGGDDLLDLSLGGSDEVRFGAGHGHDTIEGFGGDDVLNLRGLKFASWDELKARLQDLGTDTQLDLGAGQSVTFRDVRIEDLKEGNFTWETGESTLEGRGADPWWRPNSEVADIPESGDGGAGEGDGGTGGGDGGTGEGDGGTGGGDSGTGEGDGGPGGGDGGTGGGDAGSGELTLQGLALAETVDFAAIEAMFANTRIGTAGDEKLNINRASDGHFIDGRGGNDKLYGSDSVDALTGGDGADALYGRGGDDILFGGAGLDIINAGSGDDIVRGGADRDSIQGEDGRDLLLGEGGNDRLRGMNDDDVLLGGAGVDVLNGGAGDDILDGGTGADRLSGDEGADRFVFSSIGDGVDKVLDFSSAEGDFVDLSGLFGGAGAPSVMDGYVSVARSGNKWLEIAVDADGGSDFETVALVKGTDVQDLSSALYLG